MFYSYFWHWLQSFIQWWFCWTKSLTDLFQEMHPLDADRTKMQVVCVYVCVRQRGRVRERLREREREEEKAHKQGLQSILASINQLRKERVEFAYPPPVWEAGREELDPQPGVLTWMGKGERGIFQRKEREAVSWMDWIEQGWGKRKLWVKK